MALSHSEMQWASSIATGKFLPAIKSRNPGWAVRSGATYNNDLPAHHRLHALHLLRTLRTVQIRRRHAVSCRAST